jgi:hypothetical protein
MITYLPQKHYKCYPNAQFEHSPIRCGLFWDIWGLAEFFHPGQNVAELQGSPTDLCSSVLMLSVEVEEWPQGAWCDQAGE